VNEGGRAFQTPGLWAERLLPTVGSEYLWLDENSLEAIAASPNMGRKHERL
jgi:hypothetical protein